MSGREVRVGELRFAAPHCRRGVQHDAASSLGIQAYELRAQFTKAHREIQAYELPNHLESLQP